MAKSLINAIKEKFPRAGLTPLELMQIVNLRPTKEVEIHLVCVRVPLYLHQHHGSHLVQIIEECPERMTPDEVVQLGEMVADAFPDAPPVAQMSRLRSASVGSIDSVTMGEEDGGEKRDGGEGDDEEAKAAEEENEDDELVAEAGGGKGKGGSGGEADDE